MDWKGVMAEEIKAAVLISGFAYNICRTVTKARWRATGYTFALLSYATTFIHYVLLSSKITI